MQFYEPGGSIQTSRWLKFREAALRSWSSITKSLGTVLKSVNMARKIIFWSRAASRSWSSCRLQREIVRSVRRKGNWERGLKHRTHILSSPCSKTFRKILTALIILWTFGNAIWLKCMGSVNITIGSSIKRYRFLYKIPKGRASEIKDVVRWMSVFQSVLKDPKYSKPIRRQPVWLQGQRIFNRPFQNVLGLRHSIARVQEPWREMRSLVTGSSNAEK
jgi:hypothetical protein